MSEESKSRFGEWYEKNREELNKRRRERYAKDPSYRGKVLQRSKEFRDEVRQSTRAEKQAEASAVLLLPTTKWKTTEGKVGRKTQTLFTIGALAAKLGCSVQALRLWERKGIIPKPDQRGAGENRLYSYDQMERIQKKLTKEGRLTGDRRKRRSTEGERWVIRLDDGTEVERTLFSVGMLALKVQKTSVTLSLLERKGYLPETTLRGPGTDGRRLYTDEQIQAVAEAYGPRSGLRSAEVWKAFREEVHTKWKAAKCLSAVTVRRVDASAPN